MRDAAGSLAELGGWRVARDRSARKVTEDAHG